MRFQRVVVLSAVLALSFGCNKGQQPQQTATNAKDAKPAAAKDSGGDRTEDGKALVKKVLDAWVFGDGSYVFTKGGKDGIKFNNVEYAMGDPLSSYEIGAARQTLPTMTDVMVTLKFPTKGGVNEIKKTLVFEIMWQDEAGKSSATGKAAHVATHDPALLRAVSEQSEKKDK